MIYWDLCEKAHNIKANNLMMEGTVFDNIFKTMGAQDSAKQRRELFCKPFAQIGRHRASAGYNLSHGHSLLMNLGNSIATDGNFFFTTFIEFKGIFYSTMALTVRVSLGRGLIVRGWRILQKKIVLAFTL